MGNPLEPSNDWLRRVLMVFPSPTRKYRYVTSIRPWFVPTTSFRIPTSRRYTAWNNHKKHGADTVSLDKLPHALCASPGSHPVAAAQYRFPSGGTLSSVRCEIWRAQQSMHHLWNDSADIYEIWLLGGGLYWNTFFLARLIVRPWRWRWHVLPKLRLTFNGLHGVISQKIELFTSPTFFMGASSPGATR
jgi:hypothetical protein